MADKGIPEMTPEMLEAFKAFYQQYSTPESMSKKAATVGESSIQTEAEKSDPLTQANSSIPESISAPLTSSTPVVDQSGEVEDAPPVGDQGATSLSAVGTLSIPDADTNMEKVDAVIEDVVKSIERATMSGDISPQADVAGSEEPAVHSDARELEQEVGSPTQEAAAAASGPTFTPARFKTMSTLDVVKDVLGLAPQPLEVIPPGAPENPLDCDRDIDLAPTARDLLREGKAGNMPVRSSARIRVETISKLVKKGEERRERKKAAASNVERGLIDEATPEREDDAELSFDDSGDLNFKPSSPKSSSESGAADPVMKKPPHGKKTKRKLDVESGVGEKPAPKGKKLKTASPAVSSHTEQTARPPKGKKKAELTLSSSDSSLLKKGKSKRSKHTAPTSQKQQTSLRVSPQSVQPSSTAKASRAKPRVNVGHSSTPTLTSADEPTSVQMVDEAHSSRFVSQLDHAALSILKSREFRAEKRINPPMFVKFGVDLLLKERGLWLTLTNVFPYNQNVVREFYANLSAECGVVESLRYGKVYVRGSVYSFSPEVINGVFGLPSVAISDWFIDGKLEKALVSEITGGRVKKWDSRFQSTRLTCKYAVLHKIAVACWMLSKNTQIVTKDQALMIYRVGKGLPVNFGQYVFNAVLKAASDNSSSILYPNVIFQVLTGQGLEATPSEGVEIEQLTFSNSLLSSDRKQDLPYKSKVSHKAPVPSESDDSLFDEINQFKASDTAGPSSHTLSKSVRTVLASLPSLLQSAESMVAALPSLLQSAESLLQGLKEAQDVLMAADPSLSDADS